MSDTQNSPTATFPFTVQYHGVAGYGNPVGEPVVEAKFSNSGNAIAYAKFAYSEFPGPQIDRSAGVVRVYEVFHKGKKIYRAG